MKVAHHFAYHDTAGLLLLLLLQHLLLLLQLLLFLQQFLYLLLLRPFTLFWYPFLRLFQVMPVLAVGYVLLSDSGIRDFLHLPLFATVASCRCHCQLGITNSQNRIHGYFHSTDNEDNNVKEDGSLLVARKGSRTETSIITTFEPRSGSCSVGFGWRCWRLIVDRWTTSYYYGVVVSYCIRSGVWLTSNEGFLY